MERVNVESSAVLSIGYDAAAQILELQYKDKNGDPARVYQGFPVSQALYDELMAPGASIGRIINQKLKANPAITWVDVTEEQAVASA